MMLRFMKLWCCEVNSIVRFWCLCMFMSIFIFLFLVVMVFFVLIVREVLFMNYMWLGFRLKGLFFCLMYLGSLFMLVCIILIFWLCLVYICLSSYRLNVVFFCFIWLSIRVIIFGVFSMNLIMVLILFMLGIY